MAKPPKLRAAQPTRPQNVVAAVKHHSGPLPAPEDLQRYEQLSPGAANRIISMAENEQNHRTAMAKLTLSSDIKHRDDVHQAQQTNAKAANRSAMVGQYFGGVVGAGCVVGAMYSVYAGAHPVVAIAFVSLPVVGMIKAVR